MYIRKSNETDELLFCGSLSFPKIESLLNFGVEFYAITNVKEQFTVSPSFFFFIILNLSKKFFFIIFVFIIELNVEKEVLKCLLISVLNFTVSLDLNKNDFYFMASFSIVNCFPLALCY